MHEMWLEGMNKQTCGQVTLEEILNFLGKEIPRNVQDRSHFLFVECTFPKTGNF